MEKTDYRDFEDASVDIPKKRLDPVLPGSTTRYHRSMNRM